MAAKQPAKRKSAKATGRVSSSSASKKKGRGSAASPKKSSAKQAPKRRHWLRWIILLLILAVVVVLGAFSWDRWFRYDDTQDILGEWKASGQTATAVIDGKQMHLTDEVAYDYTLNTWDKSIEFSFGKLSNSGTYTFSEDRQTLVIVEGGKPDLIGDFLAKFGVTGEGLDTSKTPTTVLIKLSGKTDGDLRKPTEEPTPDAPADGAADGTQDGDDSSDGAAGSGAADDSEGDAGSLFDTITDRSGPE